MRPSPLLTAVGASVGTFAALGGATLLVSGVTLSVAKAVVRRRKVATATACGQCAGRGFVACQVCMGAQTLRCRAPVSAKQLRRQRREKPAAAGSGGAAGASAAPAACVCPGCGATKEQRCLNCMGQGRVCLPS